MIPKRAIFFWDGEPMSWLRKQSIETFRALNPDWDIDIIDGSGIPIPGDSRIARVGRSDWGRYRALNAAGGVYFDTDIVFARPIPDAWLSNDMIVPFSESDVVGHIGVLGCEAGNRWARMMEEACERQVSAHQPLNYQELGVLLANKLTTSLLGYSVTWLTPDSFVPIAWTRPQMLWADGVNLSPMTMGVHWFGGDWVSVAMEDVVDAQWMETSDSIVAKAWKKAFGR